MPTTHDAHLVSSADRLHLTVVRHKAQAQAVLRREDLASQPRLVGVLMAGSFHPLPPQDALGPVLLEAGLARWPR